MDLFDDKGRCLPSENCRVFAEKQSDYYKIKAKKLDFNEIFDRTKRFGRTVDCFDGVSFEHQSNNLLNKIKNNEAFKNITNGPHIPFLYNETNENKDLGSDLETFQLQKLKDSFGDKFPDSHFKAVLQSDSKLVNNITLEPGVGYEKFIDSAKKKTVVGWYFPQAFQEYDIKSQRLRVKDFPQSNDFNYCLSGGKDVCAALVGCPELLISEEHYAPVLCLSAYVHSDPRLILLLKSYGPHMEFWCMTQILTKGVMQVSEQWSGGITIYT
jgi:hypothetical protein